jgi:uncharacterized protein (TIGR04255 family)
MGRTRSQLKLARSPLSLVLAQVRFERLEAMANYIPAIQDRLRRGGYPINKSGRIKEFQVTDRGARQSDRPHWEFLSKDRHTGVVLNEGFVVLQTTRYEGFEQFLDAFVQVTRIVSEEVQGLYLQRLGLRYVDAIQAGEGESWKDYVQTGLQGFEGEVFQAGSVLNLHQTVASTRDGMMIVRLMQNRDGALLPPDLVNTSLAQPTIPPPKPGDLVTLLDIDHFCQQDSDEFDEKAFVEMAWRLKNDSYVVFADYAVTKHALEVWK